MNTTQSLTTKRNAENQVRELVELLEDGYGKRLELAKDGDEIGKAVLLALYDQATGYYEVELCKVRGQEELERRVYQRPPNARAGQILLELKNYYPQDHTAALVNLTKSYKTLEELKVNLALKQAKLAAAQTKLMEGQAAVFTKALAERDEIPPLLRTVASAAIGFLQHQGQDGLAKAGSSEEQFQIFLERASRTINNALGEALEAAGADIPKVEEGEEE